MPEIEQLNQRIQLLENLVFALIKSDNYYFSKHLILADGANIKLSGGTGTKFGTATGQKLGLWNVTPIIQPASANQAAVSGAADLTYSQNEVDLIAAIVVLVNQIRSDLVSAGIIKGSA
mgnify:CR=1 FL=1